MRVREQGTGGEGDGGGGEGGGGGHEVNKHVPCNKYFASPVRLEPVHCVGAKKQHPLDATFSSAHEPSARHACWHWSSVAPPHRRHPLFASNLKLRAFDVNPRLTSVSASAGVYAFALCVRPHQ